LNRPGPAGADDREQVVHQQGREGRRSRSSREHEPGDRGARAGRGGHDAVQGLCLLPDRRLVGDRLCRTPDLLFIAQVIVADRVHRVVELVDEGEPGRDVEVGDHVVGYLIQVFDEGTDAVSVGCDQDPFPVLYRRNDRLVPVGHHPGQRVLQRFGGRQVPPSSGRR